MPLTRHIVTVSISVGGKTNTKSILMVTPYSNMPRHIVTVSISVVTPATHPYRTAVATNGPNGKTCVIVLVNYSIAIDKIPDGCYNSK